MSPALIPQIKFQHLNVFQGRAWNCTQIYDPIWRLIVVDRSTVSITLSDEVYKIRTKRPHLISGWHPWTSKSNDNIIIYYISFSLPGLSSLVHRQMPGIVDCSEVMSYDEIKALVEYLKSDHDTPEHVFSRAMGYAYTAYSITAKSLRKINDNVPARFTQLINEIAANIDSEWNIEKMSRICHCSSAHLQREFQKYLGLSPMQYLQQQRIERAVGLLLDRSNPSIESIASACGFSNRHHFSRVFQKYQQQSPAAFRKHGANRFYF